MNEEKIIQLLLQHSDDIQELKETVATKMDVAQISNTLDKLVGLAQKTDQEVTMATHGMRRLEGRVEVLEKDMSKVKPLVGLR